MRNIKKYLLEDDFAQAENNSGYPYNAMTTARPGMAYIKENRHVYFNEKPLPPEPEFKFYYSFSGMAWIEEYRASTAATSSFDMILPSSAEPVSEGYILVKSQENGDSSAYVNDFLPVKVQNGGSINITSGDYWLMVEDKNGWNMSYILTDKMYTLNETVTNKDTTYQIFYVSGDTNNTPYYAQVSYAEISEVEVVDMYIYSNLLNTFDDYLNQNFVGVILKIEDNWPSNFNYLPTSYCTEKVYESGNIYSGSGWSPLLLEIEPQGNDEFKILTVVDGGTMEIITDVSDKDFIITGGNYYMLGHNNDDYMLFNVSTDDIAHDYVSGDFKGSYKIFSLSYEGQAISAYTPVYRSQTSNQWGSLRGNMSIYHQVISVFDSEGGVIDMSSPMDGWYIFRLTPDETDLFNPKLIEDPDPDWPNDNGGGSDDVNY